MTIRRSVTLLFCVLLISISNTRVQADDLTLPNVFADHMVLQRDTPILIYGWADPGATIEIEFNGQHIFTPAHEAGIWHTTVDPLPPSNRPITLTVKSTLDGNTQTKTVNDILVGDVWICSGQSNMVWSINGSDRVEEFTADAINYPNIRTFKIPNTATHEPQKNCGGQWQVASPETVGNFSAVAYHFGRNLSDKLDDIPIGLINTSWGGSAVEAWVDRPTLETIPAAQPYLEKYDAQQALANTNIEEFTNPEFKNPEKWETVKLPALIEDLGYQIDGIIYFRHTIEIPESWAGQPLTLSLGNIDDNDITYFNGHQVGRTNNWQKKRQYTIPAKIVKSGTATIVVRVEDTGGGGGFGGTADELTITPKNSLESQSLAGDWFMHIFSDQPSGAKQHQPANLYNAMIHPLKDYAIKGAIWYQGENNAIRPRGEEYFTIFPALIENWRSVFNQPDFPFYFVQLPNFTNNEQNTIWRYPLIRQAQLETLRAVPHTGMAVTLELGAANNIHPKNKHDVGERLARWALVDTYHFKDLVKSGPIFKNATFQPSKFL